MLSDKKRPSLKNAIGHFKTINEHKLLVMKYCFKVGLYKQGLLHDLSKYTPTEFATGAKYYQGFRSPNAAEKEEFGYSPAWLHHKGRNKHHYEYWIDYSVEDPENLYGMKMPVKYVVEMFCDRVAASRIYKGDAYVDSDPLNYYLKRCDHYVIHPETKKLLHKLLYILSVKGEEYTFNYIRRRVLR